MSTKNCLTTALVVVLIVVSIFAIPAIHADQWAYLSVSRGELSPGQNYSATASIFSSSPITETVELHLTGPFWIAVENPVITTEVSLDHPVSHTWLFQTSSILPAGTGLETLNLMVDGTPRTTTNIRICCQSLRIPPHITWLPLVRR